ncbi:MAG: class I tRNA ligase family protein [Aeromonas popoffii]|jgi:methionyl-tRNA synthetase|uniref:class I tRNA ligase family protein n=1 Tax=Aeromonas popoffii TaxID=70856 RepID=UPI003F345D48
MKITNTFPESIDVDGVNVREMTVAPKSKTQIHNHHDRECWSITQGEGLLSSGLQHFRVSAGDHIEFAPFETHMISNDGEQDLCFTTHWFTDWEYIVDEPENKEADDGTLLIGSAFPSPNGPLHLGHLSGPFLMGDIMRRSYSLGGGKTFSYCGTFGNTNHIDRTAEARGVTYDDLVERSENTILSDLDLFHAHYDSFLPHEPTTVDFELAKSKYTDALLASSYVYEREVMHPYSESTQTFVSESYVSGSCPCCGANTIGLECESCGMYQDESRLIRPYHTVTKETLVHRSVKLLYLRLDRDILTRLAEQIYSRNTAASRLCYDSLQNYLAKDALVDIPLTSLREKGYQVRESQVMSVAMERGLRSYQALLQCPSTNRHLWFCGFDNVCASGIFVPYILKVIGIPDEQLPVAIVNNFSLLENRKFSTGGNHAIWANSFLRDYSADLVRLHLAHIHSPRAESNFKLESFYSHATGVVSALSDVFEHGQALALHFGEGKIEAGPWLVDDILLYREIHEAMRHCTECYASQLPAAALRRIDRVLESVATYVTESLYYKDDRNTLRTRLALLLYAYQSLAYCLYPVMPELSSMIMYSLGVNSSTCHAKRKEVRIAERFDMHPVLDCLTHMKNKICHQL